MSEARERDRGVERWRGAVVIAGVCAIAFGGCRAGSDVRTPSPVTNLPLPSPRIATVVPSVPAVPALAAGEEARFSAIDAIANTAISEAKMPGCVIVVGRRDEILFRRAYGSRSVQPVRSPMTLDTVFDLASLTKPVATATSIMILVDRKKIDLDARASTYVPELAKLPPFTVRQLLLHTSGLPAGTPIADYEAERPSLMRRFGELSLKSAPGARFVYSDVGYVVLEEIVRRVSGTEFAAFSSREIFEPLGMRETGFLPDPTLRARAAPTEAREGVWLPGVVHDPRAFASRGVAGHAGVFSTADDLARFAQSMLAEGAIDSTGRRLIGDKTFSSFVRRYDTPGGGRGLGWDIDSRYATNRSPRLSPSAFGHGGYTGTALWIDPAKDLFVVFLSNRVHPDGTGAVNPVVSDVTSVAVSATEVSTGIDVLGAESFARLRGSRVGLMTNASARTRDGTSTIDAFRSASDVTLGAIFVPEHGIGAEKEGAIGDSTYSAIPVYGLYGDRFAPSASMLESLDALVFDLQDVGTRFYTYASTMKRAMHVAAERGLRFVVLDRPNPIDGVDVAGPVLVPRATTPVSSFVNHHPLPVRHGMTIGELARLFAADDRLDVRLEIVPIKGWRRKDYFDRTGLTWTSPSPNLRTIQAVVLYPAVGLLEGTNLSVGRGTSTPFEILGAPWMDGEKLAARLARVGIEGLSVEATKFTPSSSVHRGQACGGVRLRVTDRNRFEPIRTAVALALAIHELHPQAWEFEHVDRLLQSAVAMDAMRAGKSVADVEATWQRELADFRSRRETFLLYR